MKTNKICVIICEYNPFHNGHKLLIDKARELSNCDFIACVMSGDFSQRGEPCLINKYSRSHLALLGGADVVLHMPTAYASSTAEVFARCGVNIANSLKNATHICFGSECGDIEKLSKVADFFVKEPKEYKLLLKKYLNDGLSYPQSKEKAISELARQGVVEPYFEEVLRGSNNILAIEYLKALKVTKSSLIPLTIKREGEDFNSKKLTEFSSASTIREIAYSKGIKAVDNCVPKAVYPTLKNYVEKQGLPDRKLFDTLRLFNLRTQDISTLKNIFDVSEGLENRLYHISRESLDFNTFINTCKTKRYNDTRLNRVCLASMLGITGELTKKVYSANLPYIKVLAVKRNKVLSNLSSKYPLIVRNSDIPKLNKYAGELVAIEEKADGIYALLTNKVNTLPYLYNQALVMNIKE